MNYWVTLLIPLIIINVVLRVTQSLAGKEHDKNLTYIVAIMIQLILTILLVMFYNKIAFGALIYWLIVAILVTGYLQTAFDERHFDIRLNQQNSLIVSTIISSISIFLVFLTFNL